MDAIKPNRMKIDMRLGDGRRIDARKFTGSLTAKWLHGAPADGTKVTLQAQLRQIPTRFKGYEKYSFDDATKYFETEEREIVSGIREFYPPEDLVGKRIVVICNLKPAKLRGVMSCGMLLAAERFDGKNLALLTVDRDMELGARIH